MPGLPLPPEREEEIRAMYALYASGATMKQVGETDGIGGERVRQLFARLGLPRRTGGSRRPNDGAVDDAAARRAVGRAVSTLAERQEVGREVMAARLRIPLLELEELEDGRRGVTWPDLVAIVDVLGVSLGELADAVLREHGTD